MRIINGANYDCRFLNIDGQNERWLQASKATAQVLGDIYGYLESSTLAWEKPEHKDEIWKIVLWDRNNLNWKPALRHERTYVVWGDTDTSKAAKMPSKSSRTAASVPPEEGDMLLEVMDREWNVIEEYMKKFKEVRQYHLAEDCSDEEDWRERCPKYPYNYDKKQQYTARRRAMRFTLVGDRLHHTATGKVKFRAIEEVRKSNLGPIFLAAVTDGIMSKPDCMDIF
ncbi:hypothetical protein HDU85_002806 [Gaertneriomyces sp. JEL0708]|nr:hypothetical protein HDU85_002806 [Gaertneriomyces sp. JEL0708]